MKKCGLFIILVIFLFWGCSKKSQEKIEEKKEPVLTLQQIALNEYVENLSLAQKVSQLFIINIEGKTDFIPVEYENSLVPDGDSKKALLPGGYLFFQYNLDEKPSKIMKFTDSIKKYASDRNIIPPFLSIDQEGGYVNRLRGIAGALPGAKRVSDCLTPEKALELYSLQAKQMKMLGFDLNLAPVAEICTKENENFLNGRSFGTEQQVIDYGKSAVNGFESNQLGAVLKHFPGNTNTDPHSGLPEIKLTQEDLFKSLEPFKKLIQHNPSGVLMSHARTSAVDSKTPACLSYKWVTEILKNQFGYKGIVFSDDIFMGALAKNGYPPELAGVKAIEAGVDCIMISEKRFSETAKKFLEKAQLDFNFLQRINESAKKIIDFKIKAGILNFEPDQISNKITLVINKNLETVENRLKIFDEAKKADVDLYWSNFDPQ